MENLSKILVDNPRVLEYLYNMKTSTFCAIIAMISVIVHWQSTAIIALVLTMVFSETGN